MKWINFKEKKPALDTWRLSDGSRSRYLVVADCKRDMYVCFFDEEGFYTRGLDLISDATHWIRIEEPK